MRKIVFIILSVAMIAVIGFALPSQTYAAWWNPSSWFSGDEQLEKEKPKEELPVVESQAQSTDNSKTIENLQVEVTTLKTSLDNLYTAHNKLVDDHNALLKYVNANISSNKSVTVTTNSSNLDSKVANLEKKLNDVCAQIFSSLGSLTSDRCPSSSFLAKQSLENRIKNLEGGY